jgi:hypothetical protein
MSVMSWRILAELSIKHSCLSEDAKGRVLKIFHTKWQDFCQWIVDMHDVSC